MDLLAAARRPHQTPAQWQKFSPPEVTLTAYGGEALDILSQIPLHLSLDDRTVKAVVLVQNGAPNDLLLGTDVQSQLGFTLSVETSAGRIDLLNRESLPQLSRLRGDENRGTMVLQSGVGIHSTTGEKFHSVTGEQSHSVTGEQLHSTTGEQLYSTTGEFHSITGEQSHSVTGEQFHSGAGEQTTTTGQDQLQETREPDPAED